MSILIDSAELAGLAIEGPLYGIFLCLFVVCAVDLYRRKVNNETQISWPMVVAGILLIVLATARFAVDVAYIFVAFIHRETRPARLAFLEDVTPQLFIAKHSLFITSLLVGDLFVIFRCWVIWGKKYWIIGFPLFLSIFAAGCGYYSLWAYTHLSHQTIFAQQLPLKLFFSMSLVANATATSLLAARIWYINRTATHGLNIDGSSQTLTPILRIILESGLLNACFLFAFVMTLASGSSSLEIMSEMGTPMCGIIFSIVIFRVGQRNQGSHHSQSVSWGTRSNTLDPRSRMSTRGPVDAPAPSGFSTPPTQMRVFMHSSTNHKHDERDKAGMSYTIDDLDP